MAIFPALQKLTHMYILYSCIFNQRSFKYVFVKIKYVQQRRSEVRDPMFRIMSMKVQASES